MMYYLVAGSPLLLLPFFHENTSEVREDFGLLIIGRVSGERQRRLRLHLRIGEFQPEKKPLSLLVEMFQELLSLQGGNGSHRCRHKISREESSPESNTDSYARPAGYLISSKRRECALGMGQRSSTNDAAAKEC